MPFDMPIYYAPDFTKAQFVDAPNVTYAIAEKDGVAPDNYHSTSMYPEYFKIDGKWVLAEESRMDSSVIICDDGHLAVVENRTITSVGTHEEVRKNNAYYRKAWEDYEKARNITYQLEGGEGNA